MNAVISQASIDAVLAATNAVDVIGEYVKLKPSGKDWKGYCPFHDEKTQSFYVYPDHYHCFGCGAHGTALKFMAFYGIKFPDAVKELASRAGISLKAGKQLSPGQRALAKRELELCEWYWSQRSLALNALLSEELEKDGDLLEVYSRMSINLKAMNNQDKFKLYKKRVTKAERQEYAEISDWTNDVAKLLAA
jgi:DNA primase catalytic core